MPSQWEAQMTSRQSKSESAAHLCLHYFYRSNHLSLRNSKETLLKYRGFLVNFVAF